MRGKQLLLVVVLLLIHFFIRAHHILEQDLYIDEGFHIARAAQIWEFERNPGREGHGKLLLYFWLSFFETERQNALFSSRFGMALFSLITASVLYLLGRWLHTHKAGVLALILYAVIPYAAFYERLAMADALVAGLAGLVAWRSLVFAKRPSMREGVVLGVLLGMASLAKLTMGFLPLLPVLTALIYFRWLHAQDIFNWIRAYIPPLVLAAIVVLLLWSPFAVPAYLARHSDEPFVLIHDTNVKTPGEDNFLNPTAYIESVLPLIKEFTSPYLLWFAVIVLQIWLVVGRPVHKELRDTLFLFAWFIAVIALTALTATLRTSRYFTPATLPVLLFMAYVIVELGRRGNFYKLIAVGLILVLGYWETDFASPFLTTMWRDYESQDFHSTNYTEYQAGFLIGDPPVQTAAQRLNELSPQPEHVYAAWWICPTLYFYTDMEVTCFDRNPVRSQVAAELRETLGDGESAYLVFSGYRPFFQNIEGLEDEVFAYIDRPTTSREVWDVWIYRVWWAEGD